MIVSTKEKFEEAVKNNVPAFTITGKIAQEMIKKRKRKKTGKVAAVLGLATTGLVSILTAPVTGGSSLAATAVTFSALTATITTAETVTVLSITAAEIAMACAALVAVCGIAASTVQMLAKNYDVKILKDGKSVVCTRK